MDIYEHVWTCFKTYEHVLNSAAWGGAHGHVKTMKLCVNGMKIHEAFGNLRTCMDIWKLYEDKF